MNTAGRISSTGLCLRSFHIFIVFYMLIILVGCSAEVGSDSNYHLINLPPDNSSNGADQLIIKFIDGITGEEKDIQRALTEADCGDFLGWYYDDNNNPTKTIACPNVTCPHIQSVP